MAPLYSSQPVVGKSEPPFGAYAPLGLQAAVLGLAHVPPFYRGAFRRPMANLVRRLGRDGIVDIHHHGLSLRLRSTSNLIEDGILVHPAYRLVGQTRGNSLFLRDEA